MQYDNSLDNLVAMQQFKKTHTTNAADNRSIRTSYMINREKDKVSRFLNNNTVPEESGSATMSTQNTQSQHIRYRSGMEKVFNKKNQEANNARNNNKTYL